jgi:hypothetical protein
MTKYKVLFSFDGYGNVEIQAKNKKQAEEMFYNGLWENEKDDSRNYVVDSIEI